MSGTHKRGLLLVIAEFKEERRSKDLEALTDAELSMVIAEYIMLFSEGAVDDPDEKRFIAAALAIARPGKIESILKELEEFGVSISPERVAELRRDPIFVWLDRTRPGRDDTYLIEELTRPGGDDTYLIEKLKEYSAQAITAAAAVRSAAQNS